MAGTVNTKVDMANLALAHLKEPRISDFDYSSVASRWFKDHYEAYRDAYMSMHDWDFATALASLPAETTSPPFRWKYQYRKPDDCIRIGIQTEDGKRTGRVVPYEIVGQRIMTDCEAPFKLRYVKRVINEAEFSPLFVHGFALFLASGCAHIITGKNNKAENLSIRANDALDRAGMTDAQQGTPAPALELELIEERWNQYNDAWAPDRRF